jgi:hypothetical protein
VPTGFITRFIASDRYDTHVRKVNDYLAIDYPANKYTWASPYFSVNALGGRVQEMDFSPYLKLVIEMRGEQGGELLEIAMKDSDDPTDGSETRVNIELTNQWQTYEFDTEQFVTADMNRIMVPLAFIFVGDIGRTIHVRSIQFK